MKMIWTLIVGAIIGAIAGGITGEKRGCLFNIIAGLAGASVGQSLFGDMGPHIAGMAIISSILGAVIIVAIVSFFFGKTK
ncbi:GlsB/YeaQ/YmgE family stress response membrane protein [Enterococcus sp.]|uniref:GlsB/YeaQ/YmgE family stress response membrane protein n=1 Tax=Enterococcus sp. TaxID=35783 RepID=UPI002FC8DD8C